jgi:hypothetical protein
MSDKCSELSKKLIDFIQAQHMFFVGTAGAECSVNVSPKGLENQRMTLMFCSFDKQPLILRLYGEAEVIHPRDADWQSLSDVFPPHPGARQLFRLRVSLVQTSCGYAVPHYAFKAERPTLTKWAEKHGQQGIEQYWADENQLSLDGKDTGTIAP